MTAASTKAETVARSEQLVINQDVTSFLRLRTSLYLATKRIFDIFTSIIGLILAAPIMLGVALAIKCQDGGKVFYKQTRVGKNGKHFQIYKFRSMVKNADEALKNLLTTDPESAKEFKKTQKLKNDPRITKIGKFIRKTSLDELPQLLNILNGSMSLVGPRPLIVGEIEEHHGDKGFYESVRPGLTGWWGCNGRSDTDDYKERLELEYYYVSNCSIKLDTKIIFKTALSVLGQKGAE